MDAPTEFSHHALMRFREHYPEATSIHAKEAWLQGEDLSAELAAAVLCRRVQSVRDQYRLTQDGRGLFVAVGVRVITYLRLSVIATRILRPAAVPEVEVPEPVAAPETKVKLKAKPKTESAFDQGVKHRMEAVAAIEKHTGKKFIKKTSVARRLELWLSTHKLTKWATVAYIAKRMDPVKLELRVEDVIVCLDTYHLHKRRLVFTCRDPEPQER